MDERTRSDAIKWLSDKGYGPRVNDEMTDGEIAELLWAELQELLPVADDKNEFQGFVPKGAFGI